MRYGHRPGDIDDYAWRDVRLFLETLPAIQASENPFVGEFDG